MQHNPQLTQEPAAYLVKPTAEASVSSLFARNAVFLILGLLTFVSAVVVLANLGELSVLDEPMTLVLVGLAAFRGGRAIAFNFIFEWLRAPFVDVVDDSSGAGQSIEASGSGYRRVVGELLCCPICAGTWVALVLTGLLVLVYPVGLALAFILAASGLGELLHWHAQRDEWQGRAQREEAGTAEMRKKGKGVEG
jgi:hypothetical protein